MNELEAYQPIDNSILSLMDDAELKKAHERIRNILDRALKRVGKEKREFSKSENSKWDSMMAELDLLEEHFSAGIAPIKPDLTENDYDSNSNSGIKQYDVTNEMSQRRGIEFEYKRLEKRAMQKDIDSAGGVLVSDGEGEIIRPRNDFLIMRRLCRQFRAEGVERVGLPKVANQVGPTDWVPELSAGAFDTDLDFTKVYFGPHPLARKLKISEDLIETSKHNMHALAREELIYSCERAMETSYFSGNGSGKSLGIFVADSQGVSTSRDRNTGHASLVLADGLLDAVSDLKEQYRQNAIWIGSRLFERAVRKLKDGEGNYIWKAGIEGQRPATLAGHRLFVSELCPAQSSWTENDYVAVLFDPSCYGFCDRMPIKVSVLDQLHKSEAMIGFYLRMHSDGRVLDENGFVRIKVS